MDESDRDKLNRAKTFLLEERERRFNELLPVLHRLAREHLSDGGDVPTAICALIYIAGRIHKENPVMGDDMFRRCVEDIMGGGEGLGVHTPFDDV